MFYATYGPDHVDENGASLFDRFTPIQAASEPEARNIIVTLRGRKWAFLYDEHQWSKNGSKSVNRHYRGAEEYHPPKPKEIKGTRVFAIEGEDGKPIIGGMTPRKNDLVWMEDYDTTR